jgi:hypothetical protein
MKSGPSCSSRSKQEAEVSKNSRIQEAKNSRIVQYGTQRETVVYS